MNNLIKNFVNEFRDIKEPIKVVSHLDADGLTSAAILSKTLKRNNNEFSLSIVRQLDESRIKELSLEDYNYFLFVDLGSGFLNLLKKYLGDRKIFILDHHIPEDVENNFVHVNPHLLGFDSDSICGAGLAYLFSKELDEKNIDLAYISVIGGTGDYINFDNGFSNDILKDAISSGKLEVKRGLKMFGTQTRYLHKLLEYSTDPYIPGVTGSEEGTLNFLSELGIEYKGDNGFKRLNDLNEDELKKLVTGVILKRFGSEENPEDVLGDIYLLKDEKIKDVREYATLLNACGRLKKSSLGIGTFMGNPLLDEKAQELLRNYRLEIIKALDWFHKNKESFVKGDKFVIIKAEDNIQDSMIGTLCGMVCGSNIYPRDAIIVGLSYTVEGDIKVSMRTNGGVDLREIINEVAEGGGHSKACGAFIKRENEEEFIIKMKDALTKVL